MGGIGFIEHNKAVIMHDNMLINMHMMEAARQNGVQRYLYTSSACVYPGYRQSTADVVPLKEEDAYPADPEDGYGWEKLFSERQCRHYCEDYGLETRVVRFHNIFGPLGTYDGGREKSPAAICRKIALAELTGDEIEVWGDGRADPVVLLHRRLRRGHLPAHAIGGYREPLNLGQDRMIRSTSWSTLLPELPGSGSASGTTATAPQGVRGRNSDNTRLRR